MITFASLRDTLLDGISYGEACRRLEEAGAAVVGLNCNRGPVSLLPLLKEVRQACKVNQRQFTPKTYLVPGVDPCREKGSWRPLETPYDLPLTVILQLTT